MNDFEVAIIGAGPAGLATALQLKRYAVPTLLFEATRVGGLLWNANLVENYPGFPRGIPGPALVRRFQEHAQDLGVSVLPARVDSLAFTEGSFRLGAGQERYRSRVVVIASGTQPVQLESGIIPEDLRDRVHSEVYPLLEWQGSHVVILGAGDAAFDYALNLARHNRVTILNRADQVKCLPLLWQRCQVEPAIRYRPNARLKQVRLNASACLSLAVETASGMVEIEADALLAALGRRPSLDFLAPGLAEAMPGLEAQGLLYQVGDVKNGLYRQTAISVGDGIMAAMKIFRVLREVA